MRSVLRLFLKRAFLKRVAQLIFLAALVTVFLQNPLIFPGAPEAVFHKPAWKGAPPGAESILLQTADGEKLESWRLPADPGVPQGPVVIVLHGNSGNLQTFYWAQEWFRKLGSVTYGFDYRGYGKSTGWPTETGVYKDADAMWSYVVGREKVPPQDILLFGISLGSGPASYLAEQHKVKTLVLIAPYSSIPDVVRERPVLHLLSSFVWINFPNKDRIASLTGTCVISAHGLKDTKILPSHTKRLESAYHGTAGFTAIFDDEADHNNIADRTWPRIIEAMKNCPGR